jgi:integrase
MMQMSSNNAVTLTELDLKYEFPAEYAPNTGTAESFIEQLKKINKLPFNKGEIYYSDNIWDFSPYTTLNVNKIKLKFNFELVCNTFRDDLKNYVLIKILNNTEKIQTTNKAFTVLYRFLNKAENKGFYYIKDIDNSYIKYFLDEEDQKASRTLRWSKTCLKNFYLYYASNYEDLITKERLVLFDLGDYRAFKAESEQNKMPDIPKDFFDQFLATNIKIIDDETEELLYRAVACLYLIISQTGLRIGEVLGLEAGCLETISIFNGEKAYYIKYKTWKRENGNNAFSWQKTYVNEITKKGYDKLMELHKKKRKDMGLNYLFMGGPQMNNSYYFPLSSDSFARMQKRYYAYLNQYFPTINLPENKYPGLETLNVIKDKSVTRIVPGAETLTMPKNHQFRVHVCTELYNKGVPLKYIQKFMAHLSAEMQGYYVRPSKKDPQEDMDFTIDTLEKIVTGEAKILGGDSGLNDKIQEFIKDNHYNVETELKTICEKLATKIPIRQKTGGVCIKSSMLRECSKDARTNEFYCAYGVCPNIFHFYYMANISYRQTIELIETININKERGQLRQAQKELNMLTTIINTKLIPELDELKNMVYKKGTNAILMEYPDLQAIIENFDTVYQEVAQWKSMKI